LRAGSALPDVPLVMVGSCRWGKRYYLTSRDG
jgi:hypothetical protein